jgi:hypothetical protein
VTVEVLPSRIVNLRLTARTAGVDRYQPQLSSWESHDAHHRELHPADSVIDIVKLFHSHLLPRRKPPPAAPPVQSEPSPIRDRG